jgi:protein CpxP
MDHPNTQTSDTQQDRYQENCRGHHRRRGFFFRKLFALLAVTGLGAGAASLISGCHHHRSPEEKAAWVVKKISGELDLTDAQKPKLQAIADFMVNERKIHESQREENYAFALAQVRGERLDRSEVERRINRKLDDMKQKAPRLVELVSEFHASLSPEQREKAATKLEKLHQWHRR